MDRGVQKYRLFLPLDGFQPSGVTEGILLGYAIEGDDADVVISEGFCEDGQRPKPGSDRLRIPLGQLDEFVERLWFIAREARSRLYHRDLGSDDDE